MAWSSDLLKLNCQEIVVRSRNSLRVSVVLLYCSYYQQLGSSNALAINQEGEPNLFDNLHQNDKAMFIDAINHADL